MQAYPVYGATVSEVEIDVLTGEHIVRRVDILEDTGVSLNPDIDVGQIEGAFIMGMGYWTSEDLKYDPKTGTLTNDRTWVILINYFYCYNTKQISELSEDTHLKRDKSEYFFNLFRTIKYRGPKIYPRISGFPFVEMHQTHLEFSDQNVTLINNT